MSAIWRPETAGPLRRALVYELAGLLDALVLRRILPPDLPDHCRECGERSDMAPGWSCVMNKGAPECTYGYVDEANVLAPYRALL